MATPLFDPPDVHGMPVSWHADCVIDFVNYDPADAALVPPVWTQVAYEAGVSAYVDVKTTPPQRFTATITGSHAVARIESAIADALKDNTCWVFLLSYPGSPSTEVPVVNGVIERHDGKTA